MFEKEAEDNKPPYAYCSLNTNCELWKDGFQKGAEFGYNKAKEECKVVVEHFEAYGQCRDSRRIASLETENAELKKQVEQKQHLADVRLEQSLENYKLFSDERKARIDVDIALEDMTDNLTKAKEHIRTLISCLINWVQEGDKDYCYITDAEQFLKESE